MIIVIGSHERSNTKGHSMRRRTADIVAVRGRQAQFPCALLGSHGGAHPITSRHLLGLPLGLSTRRINMVHRTEVGHAAAHVRILRSRLFCARKKKSSASQKRPWYCLGRSAAHRMTTQEASTRTYLNHPIARAGVIALEWQKQPYDA
ncbi:hypothetical protein V3C99_015030 [Haemonchus contortus]